MDSTQLERISLFAPPWVRYMLTLSEMSRSGDAWVIASDDDLALWGTDGGPVLPMWPYQELATANAEAPSEASPIGTSEFMERLLPFLTENEASLALFPNFTSDVLVAPDAVAQDLTDFVAEPVDVAAQLAEGPREIVFTETALLETPEVDLPEHDENAIPPADEERIDAAAPAVTRYADSVAASAASGWVWVLEGDDSLAGIVVDGDPALAVFATQEYANAFAAKNAFPANARAIPVASFIDPWLVIAFAGTWDVAVAAAGDTAALVSPTRFALDLGEAIVAALDEATGMSSPE